MTDADPIRRFQETIDRARKDAPFDETAASLATANREGMPSARIVLVKEYLDGGFTFYTNRESRKGADLAVNPQASLCFYWPWIGEQVRIEGTVTQVNDARSDAYFEKRPRGSQVGAWASKQSRPLSGREELEATQHEWEARFGESVVPRPPHWGGYRLEPRSIEFWKDGQFRLHDRWLYTKSADGWQLTRLYP